MRNSVLSTVAVLVAGCASHAVSEGRSDDPKSFSRQVCLMEEPKNASWVELPTPPLNAHALRARIYKRPEPENSDPDPTEIWYAASGRLMVCTTSGASLCGHWTSKFKRVADEWVDDGGVMTMCELKRR
jgi:hypothetical protein